MFAVVRHSELSTTLSAHSGSIAATSNLYVPSDVFPPSEPEPLPSTAFISILHAERLAIAATAPKQDISTDSFLIFVFTFPPFRADKPHGKLYLFSVR